MKKQFTVLLILIFILGLIPINFTSAQDMSSRLRGKILLQVEDAGQAWYVNPGTEARIFLGRPADAFRIMRESGLGISEEDYNSFADYAPFRLSGRILLRVESNGEAYYVNPVNLKMYYLGRPADAFRVMRESGLGITNSDLAKVPITASGIRIVICHYPPDEPGTKYTITIDESALEAHLALGDTIGACEDEPEDVCPNIDGVQETIPAGMARNNEGNCVEPEPEAILGCIDETALNYDSEATHDNGSCLYPEPEPEDVCLNIDGIQETIPAGMVRNNGNCVEPEPGVLLGCTDGAAINYNSEATYDNGTCIYPEPEDICPNLAGVQETVPEGMFQNNEGNCVEPEPEAIMGCMDETALNYNFEATQDDNTCVYPIPYCGDNEINQNSEECDDGNNISGDGCDPNCQIESAQAPINHDPIGYIDSANQTYVSGWVYDQDAGASPILVHIYIDGRIFESVEANMYRPDLIAAVGSSNHGFRYDLPILSPGAHEIRVYAINTPAGYNPELAGSPRTIIVSYCGNGSVSSGEECDDGNTTSGDGCDAACNIELYCGDGENNQSSEECDDGNNINGDGCDSNCQTESTEDTVPPSIPANLTATVISSSKIILSWNPSTDDTGVAGYKIYRNGFYLTSTPDTSYHNTGLQPTTAYTYRVSAYDIAGNNSRQSNQAQATTHTPINHDPIGYLDSASQAHVSGWAYDENAGANSILAHVYIDGRIFESVEANIHRADLIAAVGSPNHGFSCELPTLSPGTHEIRVYAINTPTGNNPELAGSPRTITVSYCGNGSVNSGEECDDGNTISGDGCDSNCQIEQADPYCGDNNVDIDRGEQCDDGNITNGDGCDSNCQNEPATDTTPPVISNIRASNITQTSAVITWTTNEAADSQTEYGLTVNYGRLTTLDANFIANHSQSLSGLNASALYHFRVRSKDAAGNISTSDDFTFSTFMAACSDTTPYGECSATEPKYCDNGTLIDNCRVCGCRSGYQCQTNGSCIISSVCGEIIQITTETAVQNHPDIYGDKIVWADNRNGNFDIYLYDLSTGQETRITTSQWAGDPAIYGDKIVWQDSRNNNDDIYIYDLSTGQETKIDHANPRPKHSPVIYGNNIVWSAHKEGFGQTYLWRYDLSTGQETQMTTSYSDYSDIYGDKIVWQDYRNGTWDIYMYNLSTGQETQITAHAKFQYTPAIYGDKIVWHDGRDGNWDIYMYDLSTGQETRITTNTGGQIMPVIYGDKIVWQDSRNGNADIYMYDLSTGQEMQITTNTLTQGKPVIYGDKIVWHDYRNGNWDIYMTTICPGDQPFIIIPQDTTPPVISNIGVSGITPTTATISWQTNEMSDSVIDYGVTAFYGSSVSGVATVTSHEANLTNLTGGTTYHYRVRSTDSAGNQAQSSDKVFITTPAPDTTPPDHVTRFFTNAGNEQVKLAWTNPSDADFAGVKILRKTGSYPGSVFGNVIDAIEIYSGVGTSYTDTGLTNDITYYYTAYTYDEIPNYSYGVGVAATPRLPATPQFLLKWGGFGSIDGCFHNARGIAIDASGNVYVVDSGNDRVQKFTSDGTFITKWGSEGSGDGQFNGLYDIAIDASNNIYVADNGNDRVQKFTSDGAFITKWGTEGSNDGQFNSATGIDVDTSGNVYVADYNNNRVQKFTSNGAFITKWGFVDIEGGLFNSPFAIAIDAGNNVYVTDYQRHCVKKFTSDGTFITEWSSSGSDDGQFQYPWAIAADAGSNVYVLAKYGPGVWKFTSNGLFLTKLGSYGYSDGQFKSPKGVAVDASGNIYVVDSGNDRIQKFSPE